MSTSGSDYTRAVVAEDEYAHVPEGRDDWRENFWLCFFDHEREIRGVAYCGIQPGQERGFAMFVVFQGGDPLVVFQEPTVGIEECDAATGRVGPIQFSCLDPLRRWRITAAGAGVSAEVEWTAMHSAYDWFVGRETTFRHYEQPGRVEGYVTIGDERIRIDGWGQRDRAWGHRDPDAIRSCWSSRVFFGDGRTQHASYLHMKGGEFLFGYAIDEGGARLLDLLELDVAYAYEGGPPCYTELRAYSGDDLVGEQQVRIANVLPQFSVARGVETQQFFTFSEFAGSDRRAVGQMDHWWSTPRQVPGKIAVNGNRGVWVTP